MVAIALSLIEHYQGSDWIVMGDSWFGSDDYIKNTWWTSCITFVKKMLNIQ